MDNVVAVVETRVRDVNLAAIDRLGIPGVQLAIKSVNTSSCQDLRSIVFDPGLQSFLREYWRPPNGRFKLVQLKRSFK